MKIFKNNFLIKLIATICLFLTILNYGCTTKVYADDSLWGGVLLTPVIHILTAVGDAIMELLHDSINEQELAIIRIEGSAKWYELFAKYIAVIVGVLVAVVAIAVVLGTSGVLAGIVAKIAGTAVKVAIVKAAAGAVGTALVAGAASGIIAGTAIKQGMIKDDIYLPAFSITAEEIFRNKIALFDINFFNPNTKTTRVTMKRKSNEDAEEICKIYKTEFLKGQNYHITDGAPIGYILSTYAEGKEETLSNYITAAIQRIDAVYKNNNIDLQLYKARQDGVLGIEVLNVKKERGDFSGVFTGEGTYTFGVIAYEKDNNPNRPYDPKKEFKNVFEGELLLYDKRYPEQAALIKYKSDLTKTGDKIASTNTLQLTGYENVEYYKIGAEEVVEEVEVETTASQLKNVISTWYYVLRNIAMLVLMVVLIYSGIRIVIGSTAGEKAKYKERLMDWLVAMCLLFIMHYIMAFAIEITQSITELIGGFKTNGNLGYIELTTTQGDNARKELADFNTLKGEATDQDENGNWNLISDKSDFGGALYWPTDLAGLFKIQSQITEDGTTTWAGYSFCYLILVIFTLFFAWTYLRRVVYMAFLTIIAPLVAMTYPIDKMTDGKAQAFNYWLKEYIFNLLIQPLHLLLYTILVSSAFQLASESPLYAIVAIAFMIPAEKLLRKFFGFEKAQTPGALGGVAGAALAMTGLQSLMRFGKGSGGSKSSGTDKEEKADDIKFSNPDDTGTYDKLYEGHKDDQNHSNAGEQGDSETPEVLETPEVVEAPKAPKAPKVADTPDMTDNTGEVDDLEVSFDSSGPDSPDSPLSSAKGKKDENRIRRTIKGVSKAYRRGLTNKLYRSVSKGQPVKALAKSIAGIYGAALFGTAAVTIGAATGDPSKTLQYTTTGITGGYSVGKGITARATEAISVDAKELRKEAELAWYGEDYKREKYEEQVEDDLMSSANIDYLRMVFGCNREEATDFLANDGRECYNSGIRDVADMAAIRAQQIKNGISLNEGIAATKLKNNLQQKIKNMSDKKLDEYKQTYARNFAERIRKANPSLSDKEVKNAAEAYADNTIRIMRDLDSSKSKLTNI